MFGINHLADAGTEKNERDKGEPHLPARERPKEGVQKQFQVCLEGLLAHVLHEREGPRSTRLALTMGLEFRGGRPKVES